MKDRQAWVGGAAPKAASTGTTIVGVLFGEGKERGVLLGADTRATSGELVFDKNCSKIHYLAPKIYSCGAGTAADNDSLTRQLASDLDLHARTTNRPARVQTALSRAKQHLFKYGGQISAYLVIGGVDHTGPHLNTVAAHGSSDSLPFTASGSGTLAALSVLETRWQPNMPREDAIELVSQAIEAGIFNDLGSGSNVDLTIITADKVDRIRNWKPDLNLRGPRERDYKFKKGTTAIISQTVRQFQQTDDVAAFLATHPDHAHAQTIAPMQLA